MKLPVSISFLLASFSVTGAAPNGLKGGRNDHGAGRTLDLKNTTHANRKLEKALKKGSVKQCQDISPFEGNHKVHVDLIEQLA